MDLDIISKLQLPKIDLPQIEWPRFDISSIRSSTVPRLKIGDSVARLPIIQGGMGVGISLSGLASAAANEGGIGVIAANSIGIIDPDEGTRPKDANVIALRREIRKARNKTSGVIGVNIMVAVNDFNELLRVVIEEKADMVFLGAGLPIKGIPIEDVKPGDFAYCYNKENKLVLKRVKWAGKTGHKKVIRIHWVACGKRGHLDVTPEHRIRLVNGKYEEAQNLVGDFRI